MDTVTHRDSRLNQASMTCMASDPLKIVGSMLSLSELINASQTNSKIYSVIRRDSSARLWDEAAEKEWGKRAFTFEQHANVFSTNRNKKELIHVQNIILKTGRIFNAIIFLLPVAGVVVYGSQAIYRPVLCMVGAFAGTFIGLKLNCGGRTKRQSELNAGRFGVILMGCVGGGIQFFSQDSFFYVNIVNSGLSALALHEFKLSLSKPYSMNKSFPIYMTVAILANAALFAGNSKICLDSGFFDAIAAGVVNTIALHSLLTYTENYNTGVGNDIATTAAIVCSPSILRASKASHNLFQPSEPRPHIALKRSQ